VKPGPRNLLVTGGAGFIGGNFVLRTVRRGRAGVVNLDALTYAGNPATLATVREHPGYQFVQGDIADRVLVAELLQRWRPGAIVNFAAESHVDRSIDGPDPFIRTNVQGTFELLEAARRYWQELPTEQAQAFRFLHVSTDEVYGSLGAEGRFTEQSPYAPNSPYAASKASADHLVRAYHHTYGLPVLTTNCSNNYGPFQFPEKLIPLVIAKARAGELLPVYGDGGNVRDWLYVEDHCSALERVLEAGRPGEVYNVGGDGERTNLQVVRAIWAILDEVLPDSPFRPHAELINFVQDRPGHDRRYAIDPGKLHAELGWSPLETFESGLRKTVEWYLGNDEWVRAVAEDSRYAGERLGTRV
jgi:dTDP-glucose 4,6-dehydratase